MSGGEASGAALVRLNRGRRAWIICDRAAAMAAVPGKSHGFGRPAVIGQRAQVKIAEARQDNVPRCSGPDSA